MSEIIRFLINEDGNPFLNSELDTLAIDLDALDNSEREEYRNKNANAVASNPLPKSLIVSGPGTGKSYLFLARIDYWLQDNPQSNVLVSSFVRKLVTDLQQDIETDTKLSDEQKRQITALTLHKLARSIVEKNHGTSEWPFRPYFRIIGPAWENIVWEDGLAYFPRLNVDNYPFKDVKKQFHDNIFEQTMEWRDLVNKYMELCKFLNTAGFADLIVRAKKALEENPSINENDFFIIDEYQDFNLSEEELIFRLTRNSRGVLVVGDDEQVLYETLKSGKASLIRKLYSDTDFIKAMLPFCSRCSYHITKATSHFISQNQDTDTIRKVYLPL
ncbi:MAG: UvrD-helicase domain-containing protein, partial [Candidatus Omnitrophota bacterium]